MKLKILLALFLAMGLSFPAFAEVLTVANFTDGNDSTNGGTAAPTADSFFGTAGNGWTDAWVATSTAGSATVVTPDGTTTTELHTGTGNYLNYTVDSNSTGVGFDRQYETSGIDFAQSYAVSFSCRLDEGIDILKRADSNSGSGPDGDRLQFLLASSAKGGSASTCSVIVGAYGAFGASEDVEHVYWQLYDGTNAGGGWNTQYLVDTEVEILEGVVYDFTINVDPVGKTYTTTILTSDSQADYTSSSMGWRATGTPSDYSYLCFTGSSKRDLGAITTSIDSVQVSVPEPSTLVLLLAAITSLYVIRRRK